MERVSLCLFCLRPRHGKRGWKSQFSNVQKLEIQATSYKTCVHVNEEKGTETHGRYENDEIISRPHRINTIDPNWIDLIPIEHSWFKLVLIDSVLSKLMLFNWSRSIWSQHSQRTLNKIEKSPVESILNFYVKSSKRTVCLNSFDFKYSISTENYWF